MGNDINLTQRNGEYCTNYLIRIDRDLAMQDTSYRDAIISGDLDAGTGAAI